MGDLVLDPFLGSGTTVLASERTRRVCRAIELDPLHVDTSIRRWEKMTGTPLFNFSGWLTMQSHRDLQRAIYFRLGKTYS